MILTYKTPHLLDKSSFWFTWMMRSQCKISGMGLQEEERTQGSLLAYTGYPGNNAILPSLLASLFVWVVLGLGLFTWRNKKKEKVVAEQLPCFPLPKFTQMQEIHCKSAFDKQLYWEFTRVLRPQLILL